MTNEAAKQASAALVAKRKAEGQRKITVWITAEAAFKFDAFRTAAGGADAAVSQALMAWAGPGAGAPESRLVIAVGAGGGEIGDSAKFPDRSTWVVTATSEQPMRLPRAPIGSRLDKKAKR